MRRLPRKLCHRARQMHSLADNVLACYGKKPAMSSAEATARRIK